MSVEFGYDYPFKPPQVSDILLQGHGCIVSLVLNVPPPLGLRSTCEEEKGGSGNKDQRRTA
jgi:hypothetical protein